MLDVNRQKIADKLYQLADVADQFDGENIATVINAVALLVEQGNEDAILVHFNEILATQMLNEDSESRQDLIECVNDQLAENEELPVIFSSQIERLKTEAEDREYPGIIE